MRKLDLKKPPLGWNSFDCYDSVINEEHFYKNLDQFIKRLKPAGYEYVVIDIAWYINYTNTSLNKYGLISKKGSNKDYCIDEWGRFIPAPVFFPNGFEPLIERVHEAGLKFGLHLMRGVPAKAILERTPILGAKGITADMIANNNPEDLCPWSTINVGIDMKKPGSQEYYDSVMQQMSDWGVDFVKVDDVERNKEEMEAIYKAIDKVDREIVLSLSLGSYHYMKEQLPLSAYTGANMMRISHDIWDKKEDLEDIFEAWAQRSVHEPERPHWFFFDLDMIPFGRLKIGETLEQYTDIESTPKWDGIERDCSFSKAQMRTFITQRAMAASPLFMGGYLPLTDDYSYSLITNEEMLKCNQNAVTGHPVRLVDKMHIFRTPKKDNGDFTGWIGIFNRSDKSIEYNVNKNLLGLCKNKTYKFYDIWRECEINTSDKNNIEVSLEPYDVLFLRYEQI